MILKYGTTVLLLILLCGCNAFVSSNQRSASVMTTGSRDKEALVNELAITKSEISKKQAELDEVLSDVERLNGVISSLQSALVEAQEVASTEREKAEKTAKEATEMKAEALKMQKDAADAMASAEKAQKAAMAAKTLAQAEAEAKKATEFEKRKRESWLRLLGRINSPEAKFFWLANVKGLSSVHFDKENGTWGWDRFDKATDEGWSEVNVSVHLADHAYEPDSPVAELILVHTKQRRDWDKKSSDSRREMMELEYNAMLGRMQDAINSDLRTGINKAAEIREEMKRLLERFELEKQSDISSSRLVENWKFSFFFEDEWTLEKVHMNNQLVDSENLKSFAKLLASQQSSQNVGTTELGQIATGHIVP